APNGRTHRPAHAAARNRAGLSHAAHACRRTCRQQSVAAGIARDRDSAELPGRDALRIARILAAVPMDTGASSTGLPALRGRERRDREGSPHVRAGWLAHKKVRRTVTALLR